MAASSVILLLPCLKWAHFHQVYGPHTGLARHLSSKQGWMAPSSSSVLAPHVPFLCYAAWNH